MIIATIKKLDGSYLDHSKFENEEAAMDWFQSRIDKGVYGQKHVPYSETEVLVQREVRDENDQIVQEAIYETVVQEEILAAFSIEFTEDVPSEQELMQVKIKAGAYARMACQSVLDLVAGYNLDRELTLQQITQMQSTFANAEAALRAGRPTYAKSYISAISADGVLVTQEMKDLCLELLEGY